MQAIGATLQGLGVIYAIILVFDLPLDRHLTIAQDRVGSLPQEQQVPIAIVAHDFPCAGSWILSFDCGKGRL